MIKRNEFLKKQKELEDAYKSVPDGTIVTRQITGFSCICDDYKRIMPFINDLSYNLRDQGFAWKIFKWCPWCGQEIKEIKVDIEIDRR